MPLHQNVLFVQCAKVVFNKDPKFVCLANFANLGVSQPPASRWYLYFFIIFFYYYFLIDLIWARVYYFPFSELFDKSTSSLKCHVCGPHLYIPLHVGLLLGVLLQFLVRPKAKRRVDYNINIGWFTTKLHLMNEWSTDKLNDGIIFH